MTCSPVNTANLTWCQKKFSWFIVNIIEYLSGDSWCPDIFYLLHKAFIDHGREPASIPNAACGQEYAVARTEMGLPYYFENSIQFDKGHLIVLTVPGLGIIVNEKEMVKSGLNK